MSYKNSLKEWFKGTGGGPGIDAAFQTWGDEKLQRYDVDIDTYDHTDVVAQPIVLFDNYNSHKIPYLTVIRMWDKVYDYLLSAKHDPLRLLLVVEKWGLLTMMDQTVQQQFLAVWFGANC